jgi:hypothetical protein
MIRFRDLNSPRTAMIAGNVDLLFENSVPLGAKSRMLNLATQSLILNSKLTRLRQ